MSKAIGLLTFLAACFYGLTIITLYGYNGYFGIPYNYIEYTSIYPIVFFFDLLRLGSAVGESTTFWGWFGVFVTIILGAIAFFFSRISRWGMILAGMVFVLWLPFGFYKFGRYVAANTADFFSVPTSCVPDGTADLYIAPTIYEGQAVFVSVSTSTLRLQPGLLTRPIADLKCEMKKVYIGKVTGA
jgi:hypothetical protein